MPDSASSFSKLRLIRDASLNNADWEQIKICRGSHNRFGFAYQIAFVRIMGRFPKQTPFEIEYEILNFAALQMDAAPDLIENYQKRRQTISEHQQRIQVYLALRSFDDRAEQKLSDYISQEALRLDKLSSLIAKAQQWLEAEQYLIPADYIVRRIVQAERKKAREHMYEHMMALLEPAMRETLDALLVVDEKYAFSSLQKIRFTPSKPSGNAMVQLMEKIDLIEQTGIFSFNIDWINPNYQRSLFHHVRNVSADKLRNTPPARRYLALVCYLYQAWRDTIDQAVDMYGKLLERHKSQVGRLLDERLKSQRHSLDRVVGNYTTLGTILLDPQISDHDVRTRMLEAVSADELRQDQLSFAHWTKGDSKARFDEFSARHTSLQRFAMPFLMRLKFINDQHTISSPTLEAVELYREMRKAGRRNLPDEAKVGFIPKGLQSIVQQDGFIHRAKWESALFLKVRDEITAGNMAVEGGKNFGRFEHFFLPQPEWRKASHAFWEKSGLPARSDDAIAFLKQRLNKAFDQFLITVQDNKQVVFDDTGWRLKNDQNETLTSEKAQELKSLRRWLDNNIRPIKLADLIIEVDNDLGFTGHFIPSGEVASNDAQQVCALLATILAYGCNLGLQTMEKITQGVTYKQLRRLSDEWLLEENQRMALASIVQGISRLDAPRFWGDGTTSASDGQRFAMPHKVLQQTYSTKFNDFALEFYSFVADNYAPFYSQPIECTNRDAPFVLDGVLYHESDNAFVRAFAICITNAFMVQISREIMDHWKLSLKEESVP